MSEEHLARSRMRRRVREFVLALLPPLILGAYARWPGNWGLAYVALVPWALLYTDPARARLGWLSWLGAVWLAQVFLYPQAERFGWFVPGVLATLNFWPWIPCAPLWRAIHRRWPLPRTLSVPLVWTGVEWLRAEWSLSHLDLFPLGASQAPLLPAIQIADLTGVYGVSCLVAASNGLLADALFSWREGARDGGWPAGVRALSRSRRTALCALAVGMAWGGALGYGSWKLGRVETVAGPRVALVQPNVRHKGTNAAGVQLTQLWMTETRVEAGAADLIVWPENAIMANLLREPDYLADLSWIASRKRAWLLAGAMDKPLPGRNTNTAFLVRPDGSIGGRYDKLMLFPGGEYLPLDGWLGRLAPPLQRFVRKLTRRAWGFFPTAIPGDGMRLLELEWEGQRLPFAVLLCVENIYPALPAEAARLGARLFVNITSEGELGGSVQVQLMRLCQLRAVENRTAYVRVGNTGISGVVDPSGRVQRLLVGDEGRLNADAGVLLAQVPLHAGTGPTLYARSRDGFAKGCLIVACALAMLGMARGRKAALSLVTGLCACTAVAPHGAQDPRAALLAGQASLREGRPDRAAALLEIACSAAASCREALEPLTVAWVMSGEPERGILFLESLRKRFPELEAELWERLGMLHEEARDERVALEAYRQAIAREPTSGRYDRLGKLLLSLGWIVEAERVYREARARFPEAPEPVRGLAQALRAGGRSAEALPLLEALVRERPADAEGWLELGRVYLDLGRLDAARGAFEEVLRARPGSVLARLMLARVAIREGRLQAARVRLAEILELEDRLARGRPAGS